MQNKDRLSNIELLRIITMLLIVVHHCVLHSGLIKSIMTEPISAQNWLVACLGMWGKTGINCFVLITGYFMCGSQITLRKFLKLVLEVMFYGITIYLILAAAGLDTLSFFQAIYSASPVKSVSGEFTSCYMLFFLLVPFLKALVDNISRFKHLTLVALCLLISSFTWFTPAKSHMNYVTWFSILFLIGSYIRKYGIMPQWGFKKWLFATFAVVGASLLTVLVQFWRGKWPWTFVEGAYAPMAVACAVCMFMLFLHIKIPTNRFINTVAASTYGILLIHDHSFAMRQLIWRDGLNVIECHSTPYCIPYVLLCSIAVFTVCSSIDIFRLRFIERPILDMAYNTLGPKAERLMKFLKKKAE